FGAPETASPQSTSDGGGTHDRTITEDTITGTVVLTDRTIGDVVTFDQTGASMSSRETDTWSITRGDPLSARTTSERSWSIRWNADLAVEVRTHSELWCDAEYFHTSDVIVAFENGEKCFTSTRSSNHRRH
ncbi:MAG: hypothetical protein ACN4GZ_19220, partial [Acidimicrobiales bacterium]